MSDIKQRRNEGEDNERQNEGNEAGQELESEMEIRDEARRRFEQDKSKNLNQGYEDPVEAKHAGINWGPSYKVRHKKHETGKSDRDPEVKGPDTKD